eukprot:CAMPEP_0197173738 /NCGR_PEP_ID=MMETSP1423-20130617/548_1 /TAXON_ID=476441 /ORGANISM="Pseudo-nitzschia heimii, Strain UNC1101" /LENGTH=340 /DNA_ID=CAMNT_0042622589 /DNA_START=176 /DNA_END=1198 /DNA_ORIENTATION=+
MRSVAWSMSLALSFLALVAASGPTGAIAGRFGVPTVARVSSSPWGTTETTRTMMDIRGGGLFGGGKKKSTARIYRESLEEQILLLNEQLGNARMEVTKLRESAKKRHRAGSSLLRVKPIDVSKAEQKAIQEYAKQQEKLEKEREKEQKEALRRLEDEIKQLDKMKAELEKMLETSAQKIEALELQLAEQDSLTAKMEDSYIDKIWKLEQKLADVQTAQLEKLAEINQQKVDAAVQEALRVQEAEFRAKMEETTMRLTKEHARAMEQEKLRSSKAVETERKKMRKLVRALAMREKKLKLHASGPSATKADTEEEPIPKKTIKTSSSSKQRPFTAPTSRGTI